MRSARSNNGNGDYTSLLGSLTMSFHVFLGSLHTLSLLLLLLVLLIQSVHDSLIKIILRDMVGWCETWETQMLVLMT